MSTARAGPRDALALVTRTEYLDRPARIRTVLGVGLLLIALSLLPVLVLAGVEPMVVVLVVGALVSGSVAVGVLGALVGGRAAVRLGVVDGQVLIGTENTEDMVRPLSELTDVALSRAQSSETRIAPAERDLRIRGIHYLQLTFADGLGYHVALLETDPVGAAIVERLKHALPAAQSKQAKSEPKRKPAAPQSAAATDSKPSAGVPADAPVSVIPAASPAADVRLWEAARAAHRRVLSEYGAYELEPARYLRYPGVTDIARAPVMDFHAALEEAQALATDAYPDDAGYAGRYRAAVEALRRAWVRCERDGKVAGTSHLDSDDRADLDTAAKLYNHAQATEHAGEKATYLRKVQQILVDLDGRGRVQLPRPITASIEAQVRLTLEPGAG